MKPDLLLCKISFHLVNSLYFFKIEDTYNGKDFFEFEKKLFDSQ